MAQDYCTFLGGIVVPARGRCPRTPGIFRFAPAAWCESKARRAAALRTGGHRADGIAHATGLLPSRNAGSRPGTGCLPAEQGSQTRRIAFGVPAYPPQQRLQTTDSVRRRQGARQTLLLCYHAIGPKRKMPGFGAEPQEMTGWRI